MEIVLRQMPLKEEPGVYIHPVVTVLKNVFDISLNVSMFLPNTLILFCFASITVYPSNRLAALCTVLQLPRHCLQYFLRAKQNSQV